jgi:hypothetical protein
MDGGVEGDIDEGYLGGNALGEIIKCLRAMGSMVCLKEAAQRLSWVTVLEPFKTLVLLLTLQSIRTCRIRDSKSTRQCCSTTPEII